MAHQVRPVRAWLKKWVFRLLGKDPEAVVVTFCTGDAALCEEMVEEVRGLIPDRRHFVATAENWPTLRRELKRYRIGLAPVMLSQEANALRRAAYRLAPRKILAYNSRLERHHLRCDLASFLFWRGVPLDRIYLRPWWWPWPKRERSSAPAGYRIVEGRACAAERRRIAILSPYFPYPLSHGGAVRIFHLLREAACEFDVELFSFIDGDDTLELEPLLEFCARVALVKKPRYREPRWATVLPPEVHEFRSSAMRQALAVERRAFGYEILQVEYTQLAEYGGDILVEHDITFDLFGQIARRDRTATASWDYWRWARFESATTRHYRRVIVMSEKDVALLPHARTAVVENGVDLERFRALPEQPGQRLLFIGSFRHFPNILAYEFLVGRVWPLLEDQFPDMTVTVVCGPDHLTYWRAFTNSPEPGPCARIRLLGFVADIRPLYREANLVLVPTPVSAGTNIKVLEAMAVRRAVVSTSSGSTGLGLIHDRTVWVGDTPEAFACGVAALICDPERRQAMAQAAYEHAVAHFDWHALGEKQRAVWREL
jgi:glycosyltransferase involved in cell wall biosynthesis